jgi:non-ribosomal peptide synthetase component F
VPAQPVVTNAETYQELLTTALWSGVSDDPDATVLSVEDRAVSVQELSSLVAAQAHELKSSGVGVETLVALSFEPSVEGVVAILGTLAAGAAYLPLDPRHGEQRQEQILQTAKPDFWLTSSGLTPLATEVDLSGTVDATESLGYVINRQTQSS